MKEFQIFLKFIGLLCLTTFVTMESVIDGEDICRLHKDGTILLKPGYCDRGIECQDSESIDLTSPAPCTGTTPNFNPATKKCEKKVAFSACDPSNSPCKKTSPTFISDSYTCDYYFVCNGSTTRARYQCGEGTYFDEDRQACLYKSETECKATYSYCDVTPVNTKFLDATNCSNYLTCTKALTGVKLTDNACASGTFFDRTTGACISSALAVCNVIPAPYEICGNAKLAVRGHFLSDRATCRGYYYCRDYGSGVPDKNPFWYQCPENTFFYEPMEACVDRTFVKCSYDRCDGRGSGMEISEKRGCQHYYQCKENVVLDGPIECPGNTYFDEYKEKCVDTPTAYNICS